MISGAENSISIKFDQVCDSVRKVIMVFAAGIIIFLVFRIFLIATFGVFDEIVIYKADLPRAFWVGFRFDAMVLCYTMIPAVLLMLLGFFIPPRYNYSRFANLFFYRYFVAIYFILFVIQVVDYFYFKFFQSHFNILLFGIFDDDTKAVLDSVWEDYPVILISLILLTFLLAISWLFRRFILKSYSCFLNRNWQKISVFILFLGLFFVGSRGSFGLFPLIKDDATISPNNFINSIIPNGVFALKDAISERNRFDFNPDMNKTLKEYGFNSEKQAIEAFLGRKLSGNGNPIDSLYHFTPKNSFLEEEPPNVIFILMESMSNYYFDLHSANLNLLGSLEKELHYCYLFRHFMPYHNGTIHTLEGLLLNTPLTPLSQSQYFDHSFVSSCALPFSKKVYHTAFITGAKLGWRNLGLFVSNQYFDQVEGNSDILAKVQGASECEWGAYDEFMFDRIYDCLAQSSKANRPLFMFGFTTSNHTPFERPATYSPYPVNIPADMVGKLRTNTEIAQKNFTNYQYANDCLGKFISRVRNSPFGQNTIIAVSGDHNTLQLFDFADGQLLQKRSVPFLIYVPERYMKEATPDTTLFASQKDVFPTLFNLALSDAGYLGLGNNIFDTLLPRNNFFAVNDYNLVLNDFGAVIMQKLPLYYKWTTPSKQLLVPTSISETPELESLLYKAKAYSASSTLMIQNEIQKLISSNPHKKTAINPR